MVGSAFFLNAGAPIAGDPCGNSDAVFGFLRNGWHRATDGTVTYFQVNGLWTAARGVNDEGSIAGFVRNPDGSSTGFVVKLDGSQCQAITVAPGDLLEISGFDLFPQGITNSGVIVGGANDANSHGFIARPD